MESENKGDKMDELANSKFLDDVRLENLLGEEFSIGNGIETIKFEFVFRNNENFFRTTHYTESLGLQQNLMIYTNVIFNENYHDTVEIKLTQVNNKGILKILEKQDILGYLYIIFDLETLEYNPLNLVLPSIHLIKSIVHLLKQNIELEDEEFNLNTVYCKERSTVIDEFLTNEIGVAVLDILVGKKIIVIIDDDLFPEFITFIIKLLPYEICNMNIRIGLNHINEISNLDIIVFEKKIITTELTDILSQLEQDNYTIIDYLNNDVKSQINTKASKNLLSYLSDENVSIYNSILKILHIEESSILVNDLILNSIDTNFIQQFQKYNKKHNNPLF